MTESQKVAVDEIAVVVLVDQAQTQPTVGADEQVSVQPPVNTVSSNERVPIPRGDLPALPETLPTDPQNNPTYSENIPIHSENIPTHSENIPTHSENIPTHSENIPTHSENIPTHSKNIQTHSENIQTHSENNPTHSENISTPPKPITSTSVSRNAAFQQTEVLIQYGHLLEDIHQLSLASQRQTERAHEFALGFMLATITPFMALESIYAAIRIFAPNFAIYVARCFGAISAPEVGFNHFHGLLYAFCGPAIVFGMILYFLIRIRSLGPWGPFAPTHIGILPTGIRRHWNSWMVSWSPGTRRWSEVTSVELMERGKRKDQKRITLRFGKWQRPISIEVSAIRRMPEKETLANALRYYLPAHLQGDLNKILEKTLPKQNRYTEIWTQALLNRPQRLLLTALAPQTVLHDGLYTIKEQIGAGSQGTAYLAEVQSFAGNLVLKEYVLPDHNNVHDRRRALKRLEDEVQILSRLAHNQIVKLHDVFIEDHRAYLVLDFIDGASLKSVVGTEGKRTVKQSIELALQMCSILRYLHSLSPPLVHQDFTPDNLILTREGVLKLVDFNVAKESATTKTSLVVGKQSYMPPEQFRGKTSVQSDIYALGASLYLILTGDEPEPISVLHPKSVVDEVSQRLDEIVAKATALEAEDRYENILSLESDLQMVLDSEYL